MSDFKQISEEVAKARKRVRAVDPDAYLGFVTDAACYAVAKRRGMKATDVLRAYRAFHPSTGRKFPPRNARRVSDPAKAVA